MVQPLPRQRPRWMASIGFKEVFDTSAWAAFPNVRSRIRIIGASPVRPNGIAFTPCGGDMPVQYITDLPLFAPNLKPWPRWVRCSYAFSVSFGMSNVPDASAEGSVRIESPGVGSVGWILV